jgi:acetolactate synthase-1/2/3 large subunit
MPQATTRTPTSPAAGRRSSTSSMAGGSPKPWQTAARTSAWFHRVSNNSRAVTARPGTRTGGHLVVESLRALGAGAAFGLPGVHALPIWNALRGSEIQTFGFRTELNAGFAAHGHAQVSGRPTPLLLSTGPGALNSLTALMEAASAHVPVVAISSQIPSDLVGRGRGYLHELRDQLASFAPIVKWAAAVRSAEEVPHVIAEAWRRAATPPSGPTYVEIPTDLLGGSTSVEEVRDLDGTPFDLPAPSRAALGSAAELLSTLPDPVIWAGGGVVRSGAWTELAELAARLDAPVATTYMGKGAFPEDHPLSAGSSCDDAAFQELLSRAGVVLCVGTELGAETTGQYTLKFSGRLIQIDAEPARIGATYEALGLVGDARVTLRELLRLVPARPRDGHGARRAQAVRDRVRSGLDSQGRDLERHLLEAIRSALPRDAITSWDMTILGYWAAAHYSSLDPRTFLYPLGSGTLGYAWPAALGAKAASPDRIALAVVGDGGFLYGIAELLSAMQNDLGAKLLLIDDGGYGILREYQRHDFGEVYGVDLTQPDFESLIGSCGVPAITTTVDRIDADLEWALEVEGPLAIVLHERLTSAAPTS